MTWRTILILLLGLPVLASCVQSGNSCAGWQKIQADQASVAWLAEHDPVALRQIIAHDEFGAAHCGWR